MNIDATDVLMETGLVDLSEGCLFGVNMEKGGGWMRGEANYGGVFLGDMHFQVLHFLHSYKYPNFLKVTFYF